MKKFCLLALIGSMGFLFTNPIEAQVHRQTTIYGGISYGGIHARGTSKRAFNPPGIYMATGSGAGHTSLVSSIGAQARIETPFSRRLKLGATAHWFKNIADQQEGTFPTHLNVNNLGPEISSKQHYSSIGGDATLTYHLFTNSPFEVRIGSGASFIYRRFEYRNEFLFRIDADGHAELAEENFTKENETTWGIPFTAQLSMLIAKQTTLGLHTAFRQYLNGDEQFVLTLEVGYRL